MRLEESQEQARTKPERMTLNKPLRLEESEEREELVRRKRSRNDVQQHLSHTSSGANTRKHVEEALSHQLRDSAVSSPA